MNKIKIAFFVSHPIQYFAPLFKEFNKNSDISLKVNYFSDETIKIFEDKEFNKKIKWDINLLDGYNFEFLKNNSPIPTIKRPPFGLINFSIFKKIKKEKTDIVIIHGWNYISHWIVFLVCFFRKIPVILRSEMPMSQEFKKNKIKLFFKKIVFKMFLFRKISAFLVIGKENYNFYLYYGVPADKIFFAPYSVDNNRFNEQFNTYRNGKEQIKKDLGYNRYKRIILFVGKLISKKNPIDLVKAFHLINNEDVALILVGEGKYRLDIERYIKENFLKNVFIAGFVNQLELWKYYIISDLFVLPSGTGETWGLVVNEAMNFKLPVIVSDTAGCAIDLVIDDVNGYKFREGDIKDLSEKISLILSNENKIKKMGEESLKIINKYSYEETIRGFMRSIDFIFRNRKIKIKI